MPPPVQRSDADELTTLCDSLDRQRDAMVLRFSGLTAEQLTRPLPPSPLTLAGLTKHLALVEDDWFQKDLLGRPMPEPWAGAPFDEDPDWEFNSAVEDEPETILALYTEACDRSRAAVAELAARDPNAGSVLDALSVRPARSGKPFSLRWLMIHMIEETARHAGHADLIRESIDGNTRWY